MPLNFAGAELIALSLESVLYGLSLYYSPLSSLPVVRSHTHPLIRVLHLPVCGMRRRPLQQATAKGWGEPPSYLGLDNPFRPHNIGSSLRV
jgi:hypothetical protein